MTRFRLRSSRILATLGLALSACGGGGGARVDGTLSDASSSSATDGAVRTNFDSDAASGGAVDAASASGADGTPTRQQCTSNWGTALSAKHGRLDGYLVSIVPPSSTIGCNDDSSHVHLQVMMQGAIYDVAVDIGKTGDNIFYVSKDLPLANGAWTEGWHTTDGLSYTSLGIGSAAFTRLSPAAASSTVEQALATVNHISVYGTGYSANGMHLIHYQSGNDGALVLEPQSATPRFLLFRFSSDTF